MMIAPVCDPVRHHFLFDEEEKFLSLIKNYIKDFTEIIKITLNK